MDRNSFQILIKESFLGRESLGTAFWRNFILGQFFLGAIILVIGGIAYLLIGDYALHLTVITYPLWYAFLIWAMVSIWRCAKNTQSSIWLYSSRAFVVLYSAGVLLGSIQNA